LVDAAFPNKAARVWGYVTLVASEVQTIGQVRPPDHVRWPDAYSIPSVKLARMAVDKALRGLGYGSQLVDWAIAVAQSVAEQIGCRLLVADAKKSALKFYEKAGFTLLEGPENMTSATPAMFVALPKL
jgi:GNAT superfamily N-acetyltransferase